MGRRLLRTVLLLKGYLCSCVVVMSKKHQDTSKMILISTMNLLNVIKNMHKKTDKAI